MSVGNQMVDKAMSDSAVFLRVLSNIADQPEYFEGTLFEFIKKYAPKAPLYYIFNLYKSAKKPLKQKLWDFLVNYIMELVSKTPMHKLHVTRFWVLLNSEQHFKILNSLAHFQFFIQHLGSRIMYISRTFDDLSRTQKFELLYCGGNLVQQSAILGELYSAYSPLVNSMIDGLNKTQLTKLLTPGLFESAVTRDATLYKLLMKQSLKLTSKARRQLFSVNTHKTELNQFGKSPLHSAMDIQKWDHRHIKNDHEAIALATLDMISRCRPSEAYELLQQKSTYKNLNTKMESSETLLEMALAHPSAKVRVRAINLFKHLNPAKLSKVLQVKAGTQNLLHKLFTSGSTEDIEACIDMLRDLPTKTKRRLLSARGENNETVFQTALRCQNAEVLQSVIKMLESFSNREVYKLLRVKTEPKVVVEKAQPVRVNSIKVKPVKVTKPQPVISANKRESLYESIVGLKQADVLHAFALRLGQLSRSQVEALLKLDTKKVISITSGVQGLQGDQICVKTQIPESNAIQCNYHQAPKLSMWQRWWGGYNHPTAIGPQHQEVTISV